MKKFLSLALAVLMLAVMLPITALAAEPSGSIERAVITHKNEVLKNAVSVDLKNVTFKTSVQVQLYSGDTLLTTATLQGVTPGSYGFLTCCIATETADANWALTPWTPKDNIVPNKAVLFVDGHEQDTKTFTLDTDEWANLPGTAPENRPGRSGALRPRLDPALDARTAGNCLAGQRRGSAGGGALGQRTQGGGGAVRRPHRSVRRRGGGQR